MAMHIVVLGLGHRGLKKAGDIIGNRSFKLVAVCDPSQSAADLFQATYPDEPDIPCLPFLEDLMKYQKNLETEHQIRCAYVAVPHHVYAQVTPFLLQAGIHVLSEKPAAMHSNELIHFQNIADRHNTCLMIAAQHRYSARSSQLKAWLPRIGNLRHIEGRRFLTVSDLAQGWRANKSLAGGGAIGDVGWHLLDLVLSLTGDNFSPIVAFSELVKTRLLESYNCEDTANLAITLIPESMASHCRVSTWLRISRSAIEEVDEITFNGDKGILLAQGSKVTLLLHSPEETLDSVITSHEEAFGRSLALFAREIRQTVRSEEYASFRFQDLRVSALIDQIYSRIIPDSIDESQSLTSPYQWPKITDDLRRTVIDQLDTSLSIYDNSGVIGELEKDFKEFHKRPNWHALLHNSGTNALQGLYYGAGLTCLDEVIFPVYTFHATCSPAMHFGITPVFCDASEDGNIEPSAISRLITSKTKAIVVTHMWGMPCDMVGILEAVKHRPDIRVFEDCSHAHGATLNGQMVGTFGDGAAWSLQGQKVVTGGEGGIVLTKHKEFHYRQLLWGHYNKRCKSEIPTDYPLYGYARTGAGLKNRITTLAAAIIKHELESLPSMGATRQRIASYLADNLSHIDFIKIANPTYLEEARVQPAWYAFILLFLQEKAPPGLTREKFVQKLWSKGLNDIDIPTSTGLQHKEPLFTSPAEILPHIYHGLNYVDENSSRNFPRAQEFYARCIKLPGWATEEDFKRACHYVQIISAVSTKFCNIKK